MSGEPQVYPTKFDWWVWLLFIGAGLGVGVTGVMKLIAGDMVNGGIMVGVLGLSVALGRMYLFPMRYELQADKLIVHLGTLALEYPYDKIIKAEMRITPLGGYAMSSERIQVLFDKGGGTTIISISPVDRERFLRQMAELSAAHELKDGMVVRTA